jgi:hypothetical protein
VATPTTTPAPATSTAPISRFGWRWAVLVTALALLATGCGKGKDATDAGSRAAASFSASDQWVKVADSGMTAAFGMLHNSGKKDIVITSATSDVTSRMELHEVVPQNGQAAMQPKKGGFAIPAGKTHELTPGGDHLMLMGVTKPIKPGDEIRFTLKFSDGSTATMTAQAKEFAGAQENYHPQAGRDSSNGEHNHG